jgi:hypothetical protein
LAAEYEAAGWEEEVGRGCEEGGRRDKRVAASREEAEEEIETVCFELDRETMLNTLESVGDVSCSTTALPTSPQPINATAQVGDDTASTSEVSYSQPRNHSFTLTAAYCCVVKV